MFCHERLAGMLILIKWANLKSVVNERLSFKFAIEDVVQLRLHREIWKGLKSRRTGSLRDLLYLV